MLVSLIEKTNPIVIPDSEETLLLAEESRSKMLLRQKDPIMLEKKVNTTPVDYAALNQLYKDFKTRFVPQTEFSAEQAFWSQNSVNSLEPILSSRPTIVEVPKELPKVSTGEIQVPKSVSANKKEPSQSWGSIVSDVPSSSLDECRLGMLRYQGFTTWKDLDITYSRWQFCDSNLEVAFRQHTCFIRNLEDVDLLTGSRTGNYLLHCLLED
ncbi:hypothetical protein Tco_0161509 [Tanacetum coccineum]